MEQKRVLEAEEVKGVSLWKDAWNRLIKNKMAIFGGIVVSIIILFCVFADVIAPYSYEKIDMPNQYQKPSSKNYFGTDGLGRDLFSRVLYGGRVSLMVGFITAIVALFIGVAYGAISGYVGGKTDEFMMRIVEVWYGIPYMFFVILLMIIFGRKFIMLFIGIGIVSWMGLARVTRAQILSLKNNEYIEAAKSIGVSTAHLIRKHLIPNALGPIIVLITMQIPGIMLQEAFLSFLGLGVQAPMTSWGALANDGRNAIVTYPWLIIYPGAILSLTLFSLNFVGEGLRDALDPSMKNKL